MTKLLLPSSNPSSSVTCSPIGNNWAEERVLVIDFLPGENLIVMPLMLN
jgi:hypothetical protein